MGGVRLSALIYKVLGEDLWCKKGLLANELQDDVAPAVSFESSVRRWHIHGIKPLERGCKDAGVKETHSEH